MPNWPIRLRGLLVALSCPSAASLSRNALVPERAMVPSASTRSSRLMPTPLSRKVSVLASGSMAISMAKGAPSATSSGLAMRFVAQLLAGVGGVGDEFAHENVALGINGMHHQVQQPGNVGFEILGFRGGGGPVPSMRCRSSRIPSWRGLRGSAAPTRAHIARTHAVFQARSVCEAKKKADRLGGGPSIRRPAWLGRVRGAVRGLGGKIAGHAIEPHPRGSPPLFANRWGARLTQLWRYRGERHARVSAASGFTACAAYAPPAARPPPRAPAPAASYARASTWRPV